MTIRKSHFFMALLVCLLFSLPMQAGAQATPAEGKVTLDFKDIELTDLIQTISELTGRNFIYDETVRGKVTIISPTEMSLDQAYQLFLTVLNVKGFTVVQAGRVHRVIPLRDVKESNVPVVDDGRARVGENFITRIIPLQNIDATVMANAVLAPLIPKTSNIVAYPPANTLIITDTAANIDRLLTIIRQLDVPSSLDMLEVIPLSFAEAQEVAQIVTQVLSQRVTTVPAPTRRAVPTAAPGAPEASKVIPYPRTNSLVVMATVEDLATIKSLIARLDKQPAQTHAGIYVYYLENADAESLAGTLNEIMTGIRARAPRAAAAPRPGQQPAQQQQTGALEAVAITADKPTNSLIINSSPEDYEIVKSIIAQLDTRRNQVFVEALIMELSMDATRRLGASLQGAISTGGDSVIFGTSNLNTGSANLRDLAPIPGSNTPNLLGRTIEGILVGGLFSPITVDGPDGNPITVPALSALIDLSKSDADINILSAPRLLTSDNEEAEIIVGSNVPIITSRLTDTGATTGLAQAVSIERRDVALTLRFTPQITEGDLVRLNIFQEITDLAAISVGDVNQVGPTLTKRLLRNTILAENGRTVVLGGLIGSNVQQTVTKVPLLGDIPGLGWLFKRTNNTERKTNLLIFITPRIIRNADDLAKATRRSKESMDAFQMGVMPYSELDLLGVPAPAEPLPWINPDAPEQTN